MFELLPVKGEQPNMTPELFIRERQYLHGVSPTTLLWYERAFKSFDGAISSREQILERIQQIRERGVKPVSVNCWLRVLNTYHRWRHTEHGQPLLRIPRLKEPDPPSKGLSISDIQKLIRYKPSGWTRAHVLTLVALDTGLRISELLGLRWQDVDFDDQTLQVLGKGGQRRTVPFTSECRKVLFRWQQREPRTAPHDLLFRTRNGTPLSRDNAARDLRELAQAAGVKGKISPHRLRHTFAQSFLRNGGNIYVLSRIMGHRAGVRVTEGYLRGLDTSAMRDDRLSPLVACR
jgi:integrase/recombinase XerD